MSEVYPVRSVFSSLQAYACYRVFLAIYIHSKRLSVLVQAYNFDGKFHVSDMVKETHRKRPTGASISNIMTM
jgi:hypothetical protein